MSNLIMAHILASRTPLDASAGAIVLSPEKLFQKQLLAPVQSNICRFLIFKAVTSAGANMVFPPK
jgi:hypothetical protein